jgi:hypothetical protein
MTEIAWYRRRDTYADASGNRIPYETLRAALIGGVLRTGIPLTTYAAICVLAFVMCEILFAVTILALCAPFIVGYLYGFVQAIYDAIKLGARR